MHHKTRLALLRCRCGSLLFVEPFFPLFCHHTVYLILHQAAWPYMTGMNDFHSFFLQCVLFPRRCYVLLCFMRVFFGAMRTRVLGARTGLDCTRQTPLTND